MANEPTQRNTPVSGSESNPVFTPKPTVAEKPIEQQSTNPSKKEETDSPGRGKTDPPDGPKSRGGKEESSSK